MGRGLCGVGVAWGGGKYIYTICSGHCCILQTSFAGATILTVVDQFAVNVLDDNDIISTETIGECQDTHLTFTRRQTCIFLVFP